MIEKLDEVNRVLLAARQIREPDGRVFETALLEACKGSVIEGRMPDHEATVSFCLDIGFLQREGEIVRLSSAAETFIELNTEGVYELHSDQKVLLARTCYLGQPFEKLCRTLLKVFVPSTTHGTLRWNATEGAELPGPTWVVDHLCDLGVLNRVDDGLEVRIEMLGIVSQFVDEAEGLTEERLREILLDKELVGAVAERLVLEHERDRLRRGGHAVEAACVRSISKVRVNAGYDIESFNGANPGVSYDRMIEVKGSGGVNVRFIWTENEQKVAKSLGGRYWIYFQGGISRKTQTSEFEPVLIQDPAKTLPTHARLTMTPHGLLVEGKVRGNPRPAK